MPVSYGDSYGNGAKPLRENAQDSRSVIYLLHPYRRHPEPKKLKPKRQHYEKLKCEGTYLNLGCGQDRREGYMNLDISERLMIQGYSDGLIDLNNIPLVYLLNNLEHGGFKDESVDGVILYDILEHLDDPFATLKEVHRILKMFCICKVRVPNASIGLCAHIDPTHKQYFTRYTFDYLNPSSKAWVKYGQYYFPDFAFSVKKKGGLANLTFELAKI